MAESSLGDAEGFQGAFALLDARGFGKIGLEAIFDFVSACPNPPSIEDVTRMYNEFDEDGSGDIDSGEFIGFCDELEQVTGYAAKDLIRFFERKQYEHLFNLVDDDGGGTVSCNELRIMIDALHSLLDLRMSSTDVRNLMREYSDELSFEDFYALMKRITGNKSILLVVRGFEEAQRRSKEKLSSAIRRFEDAARGKTDTPPPNKPAPPKVVRASIQCPQCKDKDAELAFLRKRVAELEAEAERHRQQQQQQQQQQHKEVENVEPKVRLALRSIDMAVAVQNLLPTAKHSALNFARSTKLTAFLQDTGTMDLGDMPSNAKRLADLADATHKAQRQLPPVLEPPCDTVIRIIDEKLKVLNAADKPADPDMAMLWLAAIQNMKMQVNVMVETLHWIVESTVEARNSLNMWAVALLPFTNNVRKFAQNIRAAEGVTQQILEIACLINWYAADAPSEIEIALQRVVDGDTAFKFSAEDLERLREDLQRDRERMSGRASLLSQIKETTYSVQTLGQALSAATKRDRGVGTAPLQAILPAEPLRKIMPEPRHAPGDKAAAVPGPRSRPPRIRDVYVYKDARAPAVDQMLSRYFASGVMVPDNFVRLPTTDPKERHRHLFQFGSRRIELFISEDALAVKVGGGYMYFEEFCELYTEIEVSRVNRQLGRSPSPNPVTGASSPSRSASHRDANGNFGVSRSASVTQEPPKFFSARSRLGCGSGAVIEPTMHRSVGASSPNSPSSRRSAQLGGSP